MSQFELSVIVRMVPRTVVKDALKRTMANIFDRGGVVRKIEYLGTKSLPYKVFKESVTNYHGNYFLIKYNGSQHWTKPLIDDFKRDIDILRVNVVDMEFKKPEFECTLDNEMKPPAYRDSVQEMLQAKEKKKTFKKFVLKKEVLSF